MNLSEVLLSLLFSLVGFLYLRYRKGEAYFQFAGFVLVIYPLFVSDLTLILVIGSVVTLFPYVMNWLYPL